MYKTICLLVDKDQFKSFNYHQNAEQVLKSMGGNNGNNIFEYKLFKIYNIFSEKFYKFKKFMNKNELPFFEDKEYIDKAISKLKYRNILLIASLLRVLQHSIGEDIILIRKEI